MKRAMRYTTIFICASLALILMAPTVLGLTRRTHLSNFIDSAETLSGGYQSTTYPSNNSAGNPDLVSTAFAINMSFFFGKTADDFLLTKSWIKDLKTPDDGFRITPDETTETMEAMYLATLGLHNLESLSSLASEVSGWIVDRRNATFHGFNNQEGGITTTLATFYAIESLYYLGNISTINSYTDNTTDYYKSCLNPDGGFAEIAGAESTLDATWAAVAGLYRIGRLNEIVAANTINYVKQFYFSSQSDTFNYGGYGTSGRATVRDTFYALRIYSLLSTEITNKTAVQKYLLGCQNIADGGFAEKNTQNEYRTSSMWTSYYAFEALLTTDSALGMLNEEVWYLPFDWVTLVIVLAVVVVALFFVVRYYRKRRD